MAQGRTGDAADPKGQQTGRIGPHASSGAKSPSSRGVSGGEGGGASGVICPPAGSSPRTFGASGPKGFGPSGVATEPPGAGRSASCGTSGAAGFDMTVLLRVRCHLASAKLVPYGQSRDRREKMSSALRGGGLGQRGEGVTVGEEEKLKLGKGT